MNDVVIHEDKDDHTDVHRSSKGGNAATSNANNANIENDNGRQQQKQQQANGGAFICSQCF